MITGKIDGHRSKTGFNIYTLNSAKKNAKLGNFLYEHVMGEQLPWPEYSPECPAAAHLQCIPYIAWKEVEQYVDNGEDDVDLKALVKSAVKEAKVCNECVCG